MFVILAIYLTLVQCLTLIQSLEDNSITPSFQTIPDDRILEFLSKYGYMNGLEDSNGKKLNFEIAVKRLQEFAGLPVTGVVDEATRNLVQQKRCSLPDSESSEKQSHRVKRYTLQGGKWSRTNLTWSIKHWPRNIDPHMIREELSRALKVWSDVSKLTFNETRKLDADIVISFLSGPHGDDYAFDGPGNILAHAFFPMKGSSLGGDAHFDADEKWVKNSAIPAGENHVSSNEGVSLFAVAAHEFGHSLGLSHSSVSGSLMFPYYQAMKDDFVLPYDDTVGIQQLYGTRDDSHWASLPPLPNPNPSAPPTTERPRSTSSPNPTWPTLLPDLGGDTGPATCNTTFDAIASIRKELFFFKGRYFWRFGDSRRIENEKPIEISRFWYNLPRDLKSVDAVYERPKDRLIVFFVGEKYWVFSGNYPLVGYPKPLTNLGLPPDVKSLDGVMVWGHNGRTYLFSGSRYWRLDDAQEKVEKDYPRDMGVWRGIPHNIDAVFKWHRNGITYFFKGQQFWRLDNRRMQAHEDSPRLYQDYWFKSACTPEGTFPQDFDFDVINKSNRPDLTISLIIFSLAITVIIASD